MGKLTLVVLSVYLSLTVGCTKVENGNRPAGGAPGETNRNPTGGRPSPGNEWMVARTKLALLANPSTSGYQLEVSANGGIVTLSGKVDSADARSGAEEAARKVEGVSGVSNQLQVTSEAKRQTANDTDAKIEAAIQKLMDSDARLQEMAVSADSHGGIVTIDGSADNNDELLYAAETFRRIPGVKAVVSQRVTVRNDKIGR